MYCNNNNKPFGVCVSLSPLFSATATVCVCVLIYESVSSSKLLYFRLTCCKQERRACNAFVVVVCYDWKIGSSFIAAVTLATETAAAAAATPLRGCHHHHHHHPVDAAVTETTAASESPESHYLEIMDDN